MKNQWLKIKQLDEQLKEWQVLSKKYSKPKDGWLKTLRVALSMSAGQFAERLGLTRGRINQLENAEVHNSVTLRTLNDAANALGCELIYAIVPKGNTSLDEIIKKRAQEIANERVTRVAHSMSLEAQTVAADTLKFQKDELAKSLIENLNKKFWAEPDENKRLAEAIYKEMQKNKDLKIITKKSLRNDPIFIKKLKEYLDKMQDNKNIQKSDSDNKFNPEYINAIKNAFIRYQINIKKQNKQADLLQKLIKNLKKKK